MTSLTITLGIVLCVLGLTGYLGSGGASVTALIPLFIGAPILLLGLASTRNRMRMTALAIALVLAIIGFVGAAPGLPGALAYLTGEPVERPFAAILRALMALFILAYIILFALSYREYRRGVTHAKT